MDRSQNNASGLYQPDAQKQAGTPINPFDTQPRIGIESVNSNPADEAIAGDDTGTVSSAAQASTASGGLFGRQATGQIESGLDRTPAADDEERQENFQPQSAAADRGFANAFGRTNANDTEPGEASRFVPNGLGSATGVDQFAGDESKARIGDDGSEAIGADRTINAGKLTPVKGADSTGTRHNLANADRDLPADAKTPFRKPFQSAVAPALLDDAVLEGNGQAPAPIQSREATKGEITHIVAAGDTYWTIAKEKYDSGAYFKALYEHNRRQSPSATTLRPGMQLVVPDEATLQRLYPTLCPRPQRVAAAPRVTPTSATLANDGQQHVVSDGDTLYDVARRRLGNTKRWAEIYELNRDAIGAPGDRLEPGTRLVLPQKE
jgi:nucleoid-associated protein YgaU